MKIEAIAFDLDGTLFEANIIHYHALNKALKELFNYEISLEEHHSIYDGLPTKKKVEVLIQNGKISKDCDTDKINELKQRYTIELINSLEIKDDRLYSVIKYFKDAGFKIACVSNAVPDTVYLLLQKMGLLELFNLVVSNDDVVNNKPAPDCYLMACKKLWLDPQDVLVVEDNQKGFDSAISAGCCLFKVRKPVDISIKTLKDEIRRNEKNENCDTSSREGAKICRCRF